MLSIAALDAYRGGLPVLLNVSMKVPDGGFVVVLGANGAGKSTLLQTISGVVRKVDGAIKFRGQSVLHVRQRVIGRSVFQLHPHQIVRLGVVQVPEGRQLFPRMSVLDNLKAGAAAIATRAETASRLEEMLTLFPLLADKQQLRADSLSGGQQQMVAIARALMSDPKLIMLDEPSSGLAPRMVDEVLSVLEDLRRARKCSILLVEQNVEAALELAEYIYVLESGRIVTEGTPDAMRKNEAIRQAYLG